MPMPLRPALQESCALSILPHKPLQHALCKQPLTAQHGQHADGLCGVGGKRGGLFPDPAEARSQRRTPQQAGIAVVHGRKKVHTGAAGQLSQQLLILQAAQA